MLLAFFLVWEVSLLFAVIKFVTWTQVAKCFLWESQLFKKGLQNILLQLNYCSGLDTTIIFLLRNILELLYCCWPFHMRTQVCSSVEIKVHGLSCWTGRNHHSLYGRMLDFSGHKAFPPAAAKSSYYRDLHHASLAPPSTNDRRKMASNPACSI